MSGAYKLLIEFRESRGHFDLGIREDWKEEVCGQGLKSG